MNKRQDEVTYSKGELVWAKIRGYPWWPGIVGKTIEEKLEDGTKKIELLINFIGDNSHSRLNFDKVAKFQYKYREYAQNPKNKKLADSIKMADNIFTGKTTYECEVRRLEKKRMEQNKKKIRNIQSLDSDEDTNMKSCQISQQQPETIDDTPSLQIECKDQPEEKENIPAESSQQQQIIQQEQQVDIIIKQQDIKHEEEDEEEEEFKIKQEEDEDASIMNEDECLEDQEDSEEYQEKKKTINKSNKKRLIKNSVLCVTKQINKKIRNTRSKCLKKIQRESSANSIKSYQGESDNNRSDSVTSFDMNIQHHIVLAQQGELGDIFQLETDFNKLLSSLANQQYDEQIEQSLNIIIAKIKAAIQNPTNILKILENNTGTSLQCVRELLVERKNILLNLQIINIKNYIEILDQLIEILKNLLFDKFFDCKDQLASIKSLYQLQKPQRYKKELKKIIDNKTPIKPTQHQQQQTLPQQLDNMQEEMLFTIPDKTYFDKKIKTYEENKSTDSSSDICVSSAAEKQSIVGSGNNNKNMLCIKRFSKGNKIQLQTTTTSVTSQLKSSMNQQNQQSSDIKSNTSQTFSVSVQTNQNNFSDETMHDSDELTKHTYTIDSDKNNNIIDRCDTEKIIIEQDNQQLQKQMQQYNNGQEISISDQINNLQNKSIINEPLRKKIILKLYKYLCSGQDGNKQKFQDQSIKIEQLLRLHYPLMDSQYKNKVKQILYLIKKAIIQQSQMESIFDENQINFDIICNLFINQNFSQSLIQYINLENLYDQHYQQEPEPAKPKQQQQILQKRQN